MKNKKTIISLTIVLAVMLFVIVITLILKSQSSDKISFDNNKYISKGQFFEKIVKEYSMTSNKYSSHEIENSKNYNVFADVLVEWEYITKEQAKNTSNPLTRELAAYILVNSVSAHDTYNIEIKDIDNCENKQAIIDSVGMEIFELKDGNFNPKNYIKHEDVEIIMENALSYVANFHFSNSYEKKEFNDLKITLNNKEYSYPFEKISDFINNGWEVKEGKELLNKTIEDIISSFEENMFYVGFNSISLQQDNIVLDITFDTNELKNKVIDSEIICLKVYQLDENKTSNIDFYGLNFNIKINEIDIREIFGAAPFGILSDSEEEINSILLRLNEIHDVRIEISKDIKKDKLLSIAISKD